MQVEKLAAVLTQMQIADFLGIAEKTLRTRIMDDPDVALAYRRGKAKAIAGVGAGVLKKALAGDPASERLYLLTQGGWSEKHQLEHTGEGGGPVEVIVTHRVVDPSESRDQP